jgi:hypothetical protein
LYKSDFNQGDFILTQAMKPKKYGSPKKLGEAWLQNQILGDAIVSKSGYVLTATTEMIWNGYRGQVLVLRNRNLPFVIALRESAASLGKEAQKVINGALGLLSDPFMTGIQRPTFVKINSLEDPSLQSCDLAALQPLVLESVTQALEYEMHRQNNNKHRDMELLERSWKQEGAMLSLVGLSMPQTLEDKKFVVHAARRMVGSIFE